MSRLYTGSVFRQVVAFLSLMLAQVAASWADEPMRSIGDEIEFGEEVSAILTRSGCNSGACHGSLHGKGGFRLSLKGESPDLDFRSIAIDLSGRRIDSLFPEESLLLAKPTGQIPHQGGTLFSKESIEYQNLLRWIESGARRVPAAVSPERELVAISLDIDKSFLDEDRSERISEANQLQDNLAERWIWSSAGFRPVPLIALAQWSDSTQTDITPWVLLECSSVFGVNLTKDGIVSVERPIDTTITAFFLGHHAALRLNFVKQSTDNLSETGENQAESPVSSTPPNWIDLAIDERLAKLGLEKEPDASPESWLRRLYLTVLGRIPSPAEQERYLRSDPATRDLAAVDIVLADPQYAALLALRWSDIVRNEPKGMSEEGVEIWNNWFRDAFAQDRPLKDITREMLVTMGSTFESPAASFYRTHRDPESAAEAVGQVFLGIRMQCAKCHNHPFDVWTQDDYYGLSAYFVPLERKQIDNAPRDSLDTHIITGDEVISWSGKKAEMAHPGRPQKIPATPLTRFTSHSTSPPAAEENTLDAPAELTALADSITNGNTQFERNMVNRLWAHVFGIGIVDPIDDFRASNPPSNPELLERLREAYVENGSSTRWLVREMLLSQAFRRRSIEFTNQASDSVRSMQFAGYTPKRLIAEVLLDSLSDATSTRNQFDVQTQTRGVKLGGKFYARAVTYASVPKKHSLLKAFGKPERLTDCDCERSPDVSLRQSLILFNDREVTDRLRAPEGLVKKLASSLSTSAVEMPEEGELDSNGEVKDTAVQVIDRLFRQVLCRAPTELEVSQLVERLERSDNATHFLEDLTWALLNSKEFLFLY